MNTTNRPTTPLPWRRADGHFQHVTGGDLAYIVHAANAYPKLMDALRTLVAWAEQSEDAGRDSEVRQARALLAELEEA